MTAFNGQNLFDAGLTRFHVEGLSLRHALHESPDQRGAHLVAQGVEARAITQTGTLLADTVAQLQQRIDAIEAQLNGTPALLTDDLQRDWPNTVMIRFAPGKAVPAGVRWKLDYQIDYLQVML